VVEAVVDVINPGPAEQETATAFFLDVTRRLQAVGARHGVRHLVTLSIVGIDRAAAYGYYAAKLDQERAALAGPVPATVLRATQFHGFAAQVLARGRRDDMVHVPDLRVQTVAARTVGGVLVELLEAGPAGRAPDLAGPEPADLVELARALAERRGFPVTVVAGPPPAGVPADALLPGPGARLEGPPFRSWLAGPDVPALT
jgi:uncharacterized protein YbjT (DUF2867 family)